MPYIASGNNGSQKYPDGYHDIEKQLSSLSINRHQLYKIIKLLFQRYKMYVG